MLRDKCITVTLRRSMWRNNKQDRVATETANATLGCGKAGRFSKKLLSKCTELRDAYRAFDDLHQFVCDNTLPWADGGTRVLPNESYIDFARELGKRRTEAMQKVLALSRVWDKEVINDRIQLGGVYDPNDYPSATEMAAQWDVRVMFAPIPSASDSRIDMAESDKEELESQMAEVEAQATTHLLNEIMKPVQAMATKLAVPIGEKGSVFRDTLVSNVLDVCERAKRLNINHDERINELVEDCEAALAGVDAQALRESDAVRKTTANKMSDIEKKLNQWF